MWLSFLSHLPVGFLTACWLQAGAFSLLSPGLSDKGAVGFGKGEGLLELGVTPCREQVLNAAGLEGERRSLVDGDLSVCAEGFS